MKTRLCRRRGVERPGRQLGGLKGQKMSVVLGVRMPPSQLSAAWPRRPLTLCPQVLRAEHFQGWRAHYQAKKGSQCKLGSHLLSPTLHLPLHRTGRGESAELAFPQGAAGGEPVSRHTRMCLETVVVPQFWRALAETPGHGVDRRGDSGFWGAFGGQAQARQTSEPLACLPHPPMPPPTSGASPAFPHAPMGHMLSPTHRGPVSGKG